MAMTTKGANECITVQSGQLSAAVAVECPTATWTSAKSKRTARHTTTIVCKVLTFGRRSIRACVSVCFNAIS
jgi:hypothetical protein